MGGGRAVPVVEAVTGGGVRSLGATRILRRGVTVLRARRLGGRSSGTFALARVGCTGVSANPGRKKIINFLSRK